MSPQQETRGRNAQLERVLQIIQDLTRLGGCDLYELADRYGTSVKTIRRDLEALQRAGIAMDQEDEPDGRRLRWRLRLQDSRLTQAATGLDAGHYLALRIVMAEAASVARTSGLYAALEDLLARIESAVGPKGRPRLAAIEAAFLSWGKQGYARDARDLVWPLTEAVAKRRICLVRYRALGADQVREHEVLPLKLVVHDRTIYLVCRFEHRQAIGFLHLHRVEGVTVTSREATPPPDFDEATFADSAFGIVPGDEVVTYQLRFSAAVRPYIV